MILNLKSLMQTYCHTHTYIHLHRNMREMKQDNICSFVGAFVQQRRGAQGDVAKVALVTEYCMKGSLLDILAIEDIKLDRLFISSLVHDLLRVSGRNDLVVGGMV